MTPTTKHQQIAVAEIIAYWQGHKVAVTDVFEDKAVIELGHIPDYGLIVNKKELLPVITVSQTV